MRGLAAAIAFVERFGPATDDEVFGEAGRALIRMPGCSASLIMANASAPIRPASRIMPICCLDLSWTHGVMSGMRVESALFRAPANAPACA